MSDETQRAGALPASVVIVAWQDHAQLDETLAGLVSQTAGDFEVIVADNGAGLADRLESWKTRLELRHLDLEANRGVSAARNAAVAVAHGEVICFLDDDAIPNETWIGALCAALEAPEVVAVRGRVVGRNASLLNELARAYDLGTQPRRAILNTEGNCAVARSVLEQVGGFNEDMFGHEGAELSARIVAVHGDGSIMYAPTAVIRHDYVSSVGGYIRKRFRHGKMLGHLDLSQVRRSAAQSVRRSPWTMRRLALIPVKVIGVVAEAGGMVWARLRR